MGFKAIQAGEQLSLSFNASLTFRDRNQETLKKLLVFMTEYLGLPGTQRLRCVLPLAAFAVIATRSV